MTDGVRTRLLPPHAVLAAPSVFLFALALLPALAHAQQLGSGLAAPTPSAPAPSIVGLELVGGATAPVDLHGGARVTFFDRVYVGATLGAGVYGDAYTGVARASMGDATAQVVQPLASSPFVATLSVGVRPIGGLELVAGYTVMHASSSYAPSTFAAAVPEASLAASYGVSAVGLDVTLHALHVELAYTFTIGDHFLIRPSIGWTQTLASSAVVTTSPASSDAQVSAMLATSSATLSSEIPKYAMTPTLGLELGWRL